MTINVYKKEPRSRERGDLGDYFPKRKTQAVLQRSRTCESPENESNFTACVFFLKAFSFDKDRNTLPSAANQPLLTREPKSDKTYLGPRGELSERLIEPDLESGADVSASAGGSNPPLSSLILRSIVGS